jgi:phage head maturation protease
MTARYLQGFACLYSVRHHFRGGIDIFQRSCFSDSLRRFNDVMYGIDHQYHKPKLGRQDDGSLELCDTDIGLAFRLKIQPGHMESLDGRDQVSVACIPHEVEFRDGVRYIKSASLVEVSSVYLGAMTTTHAVFVY